MFNLDQVIVEWRKRMVAGGVKTSAVLDELESHLREDIERQLRTEVNAERAFKTAVERLGQSDLLKAEFAKVGGIKGVQWGKVVGIACCLVAVPLPAWAARVGVSATGSFR